MARPSTGAEAETQGLNTAQGLRPASSRGLNYEALSLQAAANVLTEVCSASNEPYNAVCLVGLGKLSKVGLAV